MAAAKDNRYTEKYSEKEATELFIKAAEYARTSDDCLSMQDAVIHIDIPFSTFYDLLRQHKGLESLKKNIHDYVIARINKGALKNKLNVTAAIWRSKQLGETDKQEIESTINDKAALLKELPPKERTKRIKELIKELKL